jgi:hypothetical protein
VYYEIDMDRVKFFRSRNPVAVQNIHETANTDGFLRIRYENGRLVAYSVGSTNNTENAYSFLHTTYAFFFDNKTSDANMPLGLISQKLNSIRALYKSFFNLACSRNGIYNDDKIKNDITLESKRFSRCCA